MSDIVISGYFGFGNAGDEALLAATLDALREAKPQLDITVLSADPAATRMAHGVASVQRMSPRAVLSALRTCRLLVSGGGTLLQDQTSLRSLAYYASLIQLGKSCGARVMVYANGIGPLRSALGRRLARRALAQADLITLRDHRALETAMRLYSGASPPPMEVTADPAFALRPLPAAEREEFFRSLSLPAGPKVGLFLRPWGHATPTVARATATAAAHLYRRHNMRPVLIPMQPQLDSLVAGQAACAIGAPAVLIPASIAPRQLLTLMGQFDLVIGMRLHALILATAAGVPQVGLSYDPKIDGFLREVEQPGAGDVGTLTATDLIDLLENQVLPELTRLRDQAKNKARQLRQKALRNAHLACSLMGE